MIQSPICLQLSRKLDLSMILYLFIILILIHMNSTAFQEFLQVFAQRESPMILFLDDLQWADSSTLRLLRLLGSKDATACIIINPSYYSFSSFHSLNASRYRHNIRISR